jgi:glyceraldehyde 3-phosphate dehydrogenase
LRAILQKYPNDIEVVAINDLFDSKTNAHLFKYDTNYGPWPGTVVAEEGAIVIDGKRIAVYAEKDPAAIPWQNHGTDIVVESTGIFTDATKAAAHVHDTVKKVIISAPAKNEDATIVLGVNDNIYDPAKHNIISNASCTTNCLAPFAKVLQDNWGIEQGFMVTVHAYTNDQKTADQAHKDLRRARAAAANIIPTTTGAAKAIGLVIPELKGKLHGYALRVPTTTVSAVDLTVNLGKSASVEEINAAMKAAAEGPMKGILGYTEDPVASSDFRGDTHSSIFDGLSTMMLGDKFAKVLSWYDNIRTLEVRLNTDLNDEALPVSLFYEVRAEDDFMRKWLVVHPCELEGWVVTDVTIENIRLKEMVEGVVPLPRYSRKYSNHEDDVHGEPDSANTADPEKRFEFGDMGRAVVTYWGYDEGLYFFTESLTGGESFHRPTGLVMRHRDYAPLSQGLTTGPAVIGAYVGPPELGFKRYSEHLAKHWCVMDEKSVPVAWDTWLVKRADYDRAIILDRLDRIKEAGFYEVLHLDLGWEADWPLRVDAAKFPNGIAEIARRAAAPSPGGEGRGEGTTSSGCEFPVTGRRSVVPVPEQSDTGQSALDMSFWVNPFSCSYWKPTVQDEHPEFIAPGKVSPRSGAGTLCVMTDYFDYVKRRFTELVTDYNARAILWDGNDWNVPGCAARNHEHGSQQELEVKWVRRLAEICEAAHDARPDLIISAFSLPFENHRLCALDQQQISDTHQFPIVQAELIQRRQLYQMTWEHPFHAIRGSWYGVGRQADSSEGWGESATLHKLIHAEMSMIANGLAQAGGSIDLASAPPELIEFLRKLFAFRKRFERYFRTYQHVLGFPDGVHVDGSGHIIDGSGFIVLVNPTDSPRTVTIPLDAPELELSSQTKHTLTDWSHLVHGHTIDSVKIDKSPEIELQALEVKYVGVNVK